LPEENSVQSQQVRERKSQEALVALDSAVNDIQNYVPSFQKDLEISDIQNILDNETALLSFCVTDKGSIVFVVTRSGGVRTVDVPGFNSTDLDQLIIERDDQGDITGGWIGNMSDSTREVMQATIDQALAELSRELLEPAVAEIPEDIKNLILLPSGSLFLLPIHAAPLSGSQELLCDRYVLSYAPSIELLIEMKTKAKERTGEDLYAVINPTGDLDFTVCEGERIAELFQSSHVDEGSSCTLASVFNGTRGQAYLHFASHGGYNWNDPTQSALILYNESLLTLADLQENDRLLLSSRLVTLSACETGITDVLLGSPDEYVGLPAGFMLSGAPCVVSSLWSVDDASTSMLMERFYSNHIIKGMDIPSALQEAQQWIRGLTYLEVANYVSECRSPANTGQRNNNLRSAGQTADAAPLATDLQNAKPFDHPYYWAGFTVNGA
jgi:CHAT domain-containing protein